MSMEQLREDLKQVAGRLPTGPLTSAADLAGYLRNDLLPFVATMTDEIGEIDESVEDLVHQTPDALHEETSAVFAGIIASGVILANELKTRVGTDKRLLDLIKEFLALAKQGEEILEEITIPDPEPDEPETEAESDKANKLPDEGKAE
jgi:hypothetical protein